MLGAPPIGAKLPAMLVAVTGGSGFVGSHAVEHLLAHGHRPRLLVRDRARATTVLAGRGVDGDDVDLVEGDMVDPAAVGRLLDPADAVVHAAATIGVTGPAASGFQQNVDGTRNVVGGAADRGLDPIVHVSTVTVFVPAPTPVITVDGPLADPRTGYARSKVDAERYVRSLQDQGAPVTIVYPGGVLGPGQPVLDGLMRGIATAVARLLPVPRGGVGVVHVADLAEALARCVVPGQGPRRFLLGGPFTSFVELGDLCTAATGRRARVVVVPGRLLRAVGAATDALARRRPIDFPLTADAAEIMTTLVPSDDGPTLAALHLELRPAAVTVRDAIAALAADGHITRRAAGRVAA